MRELKFRLYDLTMGMYRVLDSQHDTFFIRGDGSLEYYNLQNGSGGSEYVIEQFTGLLDKNGKPIYEGDVSIRFAGCLVYMKYSVINARFMWTRLAGDGVEFVYPIDSQYDNIIGTIHDAEYKELAK